MKNFIVGIDPGKNGGIVGLTNGKINIMDPLPQSPQDLWSYFELSGLRLLFQSMEIKTYVYIEDVHSMPTDGVKSAFSFGRALGWLDMLITRYPLDITRVVPSKWMDTLGCKRQGDESRYNYKKRLVEKAKSLAPKPYHNRINLATADAYLIALYGKHVSESQEHLA